MVRRKSTAKSRGRRSSKAAGPRGQSSSSRTEASLSGASEVVGAHSVAVAEEDPPAVVDSVTDLEVKASKEAAEDHLAADSAEAGLVMDHAEDHVAAQEVDQEAAQEGAPEEGPEGAREEADADSLIN